MGVKYSNKVDGSLSLAGEITELLLDDNRGFGGGVEEDFDGSGYKINHVINSQVQDM